MKLKNYLLAGTALVALSFMAACSEDETIQNENNTENPGGNDGGDETNEDVIIWPGDTIANLTNHYTVPEGKTLYNPQIQISAESETKRSIFRKRDKTKRSKKESAQHSKSRNKSFVMTSVSAL